MLELKPKQAQAQAAQALARSFELVQHNTTTYIPADWKTEEVEPPPDVVNRIWLPLSRSDKRQLANQKSNILFASDAELSSFDYMLRQFAREDNSDVRSIMVRTEEGLRILNDQGQLEDPDGSFLPNYIRPVLNTDPDAKAEVLAVITDWLDSAEEAESLLNHLATSLAPGWSAVKYILLLGEGRNGKSLLLKMLVDLFGAENVSNISRQEMAQQSPTCVELNNKLLNVIFDGRMDYVKDSGMEKTLIAGEPGFIRLLYESTTTKVQTNALYLEALQKEPKSRDKSSALQKRLVRFWFPKVFTLDLAFERHMRSPRMLGAFLSLLIDHYVREEEVVEKLAPSKGSQALQLHQMTLNSPVFQFIDHLVGTDPTWVERFEGTDLDPLVDSFMAWRLREGFNEFSTADAISLFRECFNVDWKTVRLDGKYGRKRTIVGLKPETQALLDQMKEEEGQDGAQVAEAVVAD